MENPDGTALHEELHKVGKGWQLHAARYNALGKEFAHGYFDPHEHCQDAIPYRDLFLKWLPDISIHDHGIPAHEWDQQYSGYCCPGFMANWLSRSFLFLCFSNATDPQYQGNITASHALKDVMLDACYNDPEILRWNRDWKDCFIKYAYNWMPNIFTGDYEKDQSIIETLRPVGGYHHEGIRIPNITVFSFISEITDETAFGDFLYLCGRTHVLHNTVLIDKLLTLKNSYDDTFTLGETAATKRLIRRRPFYFAEPGQ